nr:hypothetical protein CFP56_10244 [Quercus suber]
MATTNTSIFGCTATANQSGANSQATASVARRSDSTPHFHKGSVPTTPVEAIVAAPVTDDHIFISSLLTLSPAPGPYELLGALRLAVLLYHISLQSWRDMLQRWPHTSFRIRLLDYLARQSVEGRLALRDEFCAAETLHEHGNVLLGLCRERWFMDEQVRVLQARLKG